MNKTYIIPENLESIFISREGKLKIYGMLKDQFNEKEVSCEDNILRMTVMEKYFTDLERLFLSKLSKFIVSSGYDLNDSKLLEGLLEEIIRVKILIVNSVDK